MDIRYEILRTLRESRDSISGQELSRQLGITRTAVWKHIRALEEEGYEIEAVNRKGYRLAGVPDTIAAREVQSRLETKRMGKEICYFSTIGSTNQYAKKIAEEGAADGTLVIADEQTDGRGRSGRHWVTPPAEAISFTLILRPNLAPEKISMITLVMGLAVAHAIQALYGLDAGIKWPNDVVINGKKLCGILTEMSAEIDQVHYVVIGVGINANLTHFPEEIRDTATSLKLELGREVNRAELIAAVMRKFEFLDGLFEKSGSLETIAEAYNRICVNAGRQVRVLDPKGEYTGQALGIDSSGSLLVKREDGTLRRVRSGEVSVRGIYGYV